MNDYIKTIVNGIKAYVDNIDNDWNQNDPSAADYIKNRTHYSEGMGIIEVLPETVLKNGDYISDRGSTTFELDPTSFTLVAGTTYIVNWNGNECSVKATVDGHAILLEGYNVPNVAVPFCVVSAPSYGYAEVEFEGDVSDGATFSIGYEGEIVHKIDKKYLPEMTNIKNIEDGSAFGSVRTSGSLSEDMYSIGTNAFAEGEFTAAAGYASHAEGIETHSEGEGAHAEGVSTTASNSASHAEGMNTTASGISAHAEGNGTTASSSASHAEGFYTTASGINSHAEGHFATVSGDYSHVEGFYTTASGLNSHVQGKYNIEDTENKYAHIVGNGSSSARSNAHTLDWNGNAWFAGNIYVGGTAQNTGKILATKEDINTAVTDLVGAAPEMLDTIEELATAFQKNEDVVETLNQAIANHNIKTYTSLEQLDISNDQMSSEDFESNISIINTALKKEDVILYFTTDSAISYLYQSLIKKLATDVNVDSLTVTKKVPIYIAAANDSLNKIAYSNDGINWYSTALPIAGVWNASAYGDGKFVLLSKNSNIFIYSEDGVNWNIGSMPVSANWKSAVYGNGKFIAIAENSDIAVYSENGIDWIETKLPVSAYWGDIAYGNGMFVAISGGPDNASEIFAYSTDGITWTQGNLPFAEEWVAITYGADKFVAIGQTPYYIYSTDGVNWSTGVLPIGHHFTNFAYKNGIYIAISSSGIVYSEDEGNTWHHSTPMINYPQDIIYGDNKFVVIGYHKNVGSVTDKNMTAYSEDGVNWVKSNMPEYFNWQTITYGDPVLTLPTNTTISYKISRVGNHTNALTIEVICNSEEEMANTYVCNYYNGKISKFETITNKVNKTDLEALATKEDLKNYVDEQLDSANSSKLISHVLPIEATEENQTIFPINLETFDAANDTILVQDGITLLLPNSGFTIENNTIVMTTPWGLGDTGSILILKNTPVLADEATISGAVIENNSITLDKLSADITTELDEIKKSASDGKALVAGAITDKGIETAADATFEIMATNIGSIVTLDSVPSLEAAEITPGASNQVIAAGNFLKGDQTITGDANLVAANIAKGKSIFGVTGTYDPVAGASIKTITIPAGVTQYSLGLTTEQIDNFYWFTTDPMDIRIETSERLYYYHEMLDSGIYGDPRWTNKTQTTLAVKSMNPKNGSWTDTSGKGKISIDIPNNLFKIEYGGTKTVVKEPYVYTPFTITVCCIPSELLI